MVHGTKKVQMLTTKPSRVIGHELKYPTCRSSFAKWPINIVKKKHNRIQIVVTLWGEQSSFANTPPIQLKFYSILCVNENVSAIQMSWLFCDIISNRHELINRNNSFVWNSHSTIDVSIAVVHFIRRTKTLR